MKLINIALCAMLAFIWLNTIKIWAVTFDILKLNKELDDMEKKMFGKIISKRPAWKEFILPLLVSVFSAALTIFDFYLMRGGI